MKKNVLFVVFMVLVVVVSVASAARRGKPDVQKPVTPLSGYADQI